MSESGTSPAPRDRIRAILRDPANWIGIDADTTEVDIERAAQALLAAFPVLAAGPTTEEHSDVARAAAYAAYKERIGWSSVNDAGNVDFDEGWWARDRAALAPEPDETDELRSILAEFDVHREMESTGRCVCGNEWICEHWLTAAVSPDEPKPATPDLVWECTRCNHALKGNPRLCPFCGYTVYRPTYPESHYPKDGK